MVYTDGTHMVADSESELHAFALKIGMKREWFQDHATHPHYDLTGAMPSKAMSAGALKTDSRYLLDLSKKMIRDGKD